MICRYIYLFKIKASLMIISYSNKNHKLSKFP